MMKQTLISFAVTLLLASPGLINAQTTNPAPYCVYQPQITYNMWNYIKVGSQTHNFGPAGSWGNFTTYKYFNNVSFPSVAAGANVTFELKPFSVNDAEPIYFALFIDYNRNNAFETPEIVMQNSNTTMAALPIFGGPENAITKNVTIPVSLTAGTYRMRLIRDGFGGFNYNNAYVIANSCVDSTTFGYGNAYDFDLVIAGTIGINNELEISSPFELANNFATTELVLNYSDLSEEYIYSIYSVDGKLFRKADVCNRIDVQFLTPGLYVLMISDKKGQLSFSGRFRKM